MDEHPITATHCLRNTSGSITMYYRKHGKAWQYLSYDGSWCFTGCDPIHLERDLQVLEEVR
jgi:hypothetical protein